MNSNAICPACRSTASTVPIQSFSASEAAQHFVLAEEFPLRHQQLKSHIRALWGTERCTILSCPACGLHFACPFVAGDGLFYNLAYPYSAYPSERWEFEQTVSALAASPLPAGLVLEIGSGFGFFLRKISPSHVRPADVIALEYSDEARGRLAELGFKAYGEDIRSATFDFLRGRLTSVFMFQVLEHMDDIDGLVERLNQLLQPGGRLYVAVPNADQIEYAEKHALLNDMPPNHISRWTEAAFKSLAARAGWTLAEHRVQPVRLTDFVRQDLVDAHRRRAQRSGTIANALRARPRSGLRMALEGALALAAAPTRLGAWADAARSPAGLGAAVWTEFRKSAIL